MKRFTLMFASMLVLVLIAASACTPTPTSTPTPTTGKIIGKVLASQTPFPATVDLYTATASDSGGSISLSMSPGEVRTKPDASGNFSIVGIKPGKYKVKYTLVFEGEFAQYGRSSLSFTYPTTGAPWFAMSMTYVSQFGVTAPRIFVMSSVFDVKAGDVLQLDLVFR